MNPKKAFSVMVGGKRVATVKAHSLNQARNMVASQIPLEEVDEVLESDPEFCITYKNKETGEMMRFWINAEDGLDALAKSCNIINDQPHSGYRMHSVQPKPEPCRHRGQPVRR